MKEQHKKKAFLVLALIVLIPLFFILIPKHTFTKKLHSDESVSLTFVDAEFDGQPISTEPALDGVDGPYIMQKKDKTVEINVVKELGGYRIVEKEIEDKTTHQFTCMVDNADADCFNFQLRKDYKTPPDEYINAEKLLAVADFEGNFNAFYSLLISNQVMDTLYNWTYGVGHLVIAGDMMDRGLNVTQCLWLIYKLEQEAEAVGGMVHFILGNHEVMNLQGIIDYVEPKYLAVAMEVIGNKNARSAYTSFMSNNQELSKWMLSKNIMEKIGDMLFVHGGVSSELVRSKLSIQTINKTARRMLAKNYDAISYEDRDISLINGIMGPLWYRGLVCKHGSHYDKAKSSDVQKMLKRYEVNHIVIGHTPVKRIHVDYDGGVIAINLLQPKAKFTGKAKALLAKDGAFYIANDLGEKEVIFASKSMTD